MSRNNRGHRSSNRNLIILKLDPEQAQMVLGVLESTQVSGGLDDVVIMAKHLGKAVGDLKRSLALHKGKASNED